MSVVTGAGKTIFALHCIEDLRKLRPRLRTIILVPTIALLDQWYASIRAYLGISQTDIAVFSGETPDVHPRSINLVVLNTGRLLAPRLASGAPSLLIVDECHRASSPVNSRALEGDQIASLGLSATPLPRPEGNNVAVITRYLGEVIYTYSLSAAKQDGIICDFSLTNVAIRLHPHELAEYNELTRRIAMLSARKERGESVAEQLRIALIQRAWVSKNASIRIPLSVKLVEQHVPRRTIVFHESIAAVNQTARILTERGHRATAYHSQIAPEMRKDNLRLFTESRFDVLVACRAIDEGIDVPNAEVGILASSTKTPRQRIQRIGRVLRPAPGKQHADIVTVFLEGDEEQRLLNEVTELDGIARVSWMRATQFEDSI